MGLKNLNRRQFKKFQEFLAFFELLGVSEEDLRKIPEIKTLLNNAKVIDKPVMISDAQKAAISQRNEKAVTPEQITEMFSKDIEEFYPNGKPAKSRNN